MHNLQLSKSDAQNFQPRMPVKLSGGVVGEIVSVDVNTGVVVYRIYTRRERVWAAVKKFFHI